MKDLSRNVSMLCPICGNDQFEFFNKQYQDLSNAPDDAQIRCADCGSEFTKEELIRENSEKISIAVDELKEDISKEIKKELKKGKLKWKL